MCILIHFSYGGYSVLSLRSLFRHEVLDKDLLLKKVLIWSKRSLFSINQPKHPLTPHKLKYLVPKKLPHRIPYTFYLLYMCCVPLSCMVWLFRKNVSACYYCPKLFYQIKVLKRSFFIKKIGSLLCPYFVLKGIFLSIDALFIYIESI